MAPTPLWRLVLFRIGSADYRLIWTYHHALFDNNSLLILLRDVFANYEAITTRDHSALSVPPPSHTSVDSVRQKDDSCTRTYWQTQLAGFTGPTLLPVDSVAVPFGTHGFRCGTHTSNLSKAETKSLRTFIDTNGLTLDSVVQATWAFLLSRYNCTDEVILGIRCSCRNFCLEQLGETAASYTNTIPLRISVPAEATVLSWLRDVHAQLQTSQQHQETAHRQIRDWCGLEKETPFFESIAEFIAEDLDTTARRLGFHGAGRQFRLYQQSGYPCTITAYNADELRLQFTFEKERLTEPSARRILNHFAAVLRAIIENANQQIRDLPLLTAAEQNQLLVEWNDTTTGHSTSRCIHHLFEEQVEKTPDAISVVFGDEQLTYRELNTRAEQLANQLRALGVKPEKLVAICVERTPQMIAGLLGILKAGGAYVPLDPLYPRERLAFILEDTGADVLVTQSALLPLLPSHDATIVTLDTDFSDSRSANQTTTVFPENLAYIIYTSGSTGRPKGVAIEHRNTYSLIRWAQKAYTARELSGVLASTSISFDLSAFELFVPLTCGGKVILSQNILQLPNIPAANQVTLINTVPSGITELVHSGEIPASVITINLAGEPLKSSLVRQIYRQESIENVYDLYGPSEDTTYSTWALRLTEGIETIGRPLPNKQVYILDEELRLVPIGVPGELYIGGDGLARGYLNRPELTEEKFIAHPFKNDPDARLYRTGDIGRYLPDGNIQFLGRIDHQVKIRGFRIELGEVEATVVQHPGVEQCVVVAREDEPGDKRLVGYVVPGACATSLRTSQLREYVRQKLPDYMTPTAFVILGKLPLTPNGKIDRKALPAPELTRAGIDTEYKAPATAEEEGLFGIWSEVLGIEGIGVHDNFFEIGGHSLLAAKVISRIRRVMGIEVPIQSLFENPTIAALAERLPIIQDQSAFSIPTLSPADRYQPLPQSFSQQQIWFIHRLDGPSPEYHMTEAVRLRGELNHDALKRAINAIVSRHENLRTHFVEADGEAVQVIVPELRISVPLVDLSGIDESQREDTVAAAVRSEQEEPFDLSSGPLLRMKLLKLDKREHVLVHTFHHIIYDGWSTAVFNRECALYYEAFCNGEECILNSLTVQYADYAIWQHRCLQGEKLDWLLGYWTNKLSSAPPALALPFDTPRSTKRSKKAERCLMDLSENVTHTVTALCQREGVTLFMMLLTAFKVLLARYTGQDDIVVGTPVAGRNHDVLEDMIGLFVGTLALRTDLSGNPTFSEALGRVRTTAIEGFEHQDLPFEKLVEKLHPERTRNLTPLFQVFFNMLNMDDAPLSLADLDVERLPSSEPGAIFDLTLYANETHGKIQFRAVYNTELFEAATIERMLHRFQTLITAIVTDPQQRIGSLPLLAPEDLKRYTVFDNPVRPTNPYIRFSQDETEQSIPARFEKVAKVYSDRLAVKTTQNAWTYAELDHRSNVIAQVILARCGGSEQRIALLLRHDAPMIAALLAVLKAGKTYVPLDPAHPIERLARIVADSGAQAIITDATNERLAIDLASHGAARITLESCNDTGDCSAPTLQVSPDSVAYLLYTSGSTGEPKGVIQSHRNVLRHICNYTNSLHICPEDRLLLVASYGFDAAVMDIFGALLNGAALFPYDLHRNGSGTFTQWIAREEISIYHSTPTLFRYLISMLEETQSFPKVRLIVMGGERVVSQDIDQFRQHFGPGCLFINGYGPTESTVTLQYFLNVQTTLGGNKIPVGYPVPDTEVLLLSPTGEAGQVYGEIAIRSRALALGYWHKPDLTAAVFTNAFPGEDLKIYKTGDMGRLAHNGMIEFLGRKDFQVKIRGFRIELGEVEAALAQHPSVDQCVTIAQEDSRGDDRLVAYIVRKPGYTGRGSTELRHYLRQKLPSYMVPSAFIELDALPLMPNGKIDRQALPQLGNTPANADHEFVAPRTPVEEMLAGIWKKLLGVERVGASDNFFHLGGHSLLAMKMLTDLETVCGKHVPMANFFARQTLEELALEVSNDNHIESPRSLPLQTAGTNPPFFFFYGEITPGMDFCTGLSNHLGPGQPFYVIPHNDAIEQQLINSSVEETAVAHIKTLRDIQPSGPYILGGFCTGGLIAYEIARQLEEQGEVVERLLLIDPYEPRSIFLQRSRDVIEKIGDRAGLKRQHQFRLFIVIWNFLLRLDSWRRLPMTAKITRFPGRFLDWFFQLRKHVGLAHQTRRQNDSRTVIRSLDALLAFRWLWAGYRIRSYFGPATLLLSEDAPVDRDGPACGWTEFAPKTEVHHLPGGHVACVTTHRDALYGKIKSCFQESLSDARVVTSSRSSGKNAPA